MTNSLMSDMVGSDIASSDGLFTIIEEQEKKIRNNLGERTTPLLKKVFGVL